MSEVHLSLDQSKKLQLTYRKGEGRPFTITVKDTDGNAYSDMDDFVSLTAEVVDVFDKENVLFSLTDASGGGIERNDNILTLQPSNDDVDLDEGNYEWRFKSTDGDGVPFTWFSAPFYISNSPREDDDSDSADLTLNTGPINLNLTLNLGSASTNHNSGASDAASVTFTPAGSLSSTNVQDMGQELDAKKQALVNSTTALVDGATIDLTAIKHTLSTAASRTFTISYTGDDITLVITLNAVSATMTFPADSLCVSEGEASGDNALAMSGVSGDKYVMAIKKVATTYYVVCKNFGQ